MVPNDSGYLNRPNKRARASGSLSELTVDALRPSSPQSNAANDDRPPMSGVSQHLTNTPGPNLALGPTSAARTRGDDRSRKLSCKECRR